MNGMMRSRSISVSIAVPPADVYAFASDPANLPRWASGFCRSVAFVNGQWVVESPVGRATVRFAAANTFGVLDHFVLLPSGIEIFSPLRVIPNGSGSEVVFTLFQAPGMSEEQYREDARLVEQDLLTLKRVLEGPTQG